MIKLGVSCNGNMVRPLEFRTCKSNISYILFIVISTLASFLIVYINELYETTSTIPPHTNLATNTHIDPLIPSSSQNIRDPSSFTNPLSSNFKSSTDQLTILGSSSSSLLRFANSYNCRRTKCKESYIVSHMQLVMSWAPGYCVGPERCWEGIDMTRFSIHGLWPADELGRQKLSCSLRFKEKTLPAQFLMLGNEITNKLHQQWPSYRKSTESQTSYEDSPKFWKHEYLKHGSCAEISFDDYFRRTLDRRAEADIDNWLVNLLQEANTIYTKEMIAEALSPYIGDNRFYISCTEENRIIEIILCVDEDALGFISCPNTGKNFGCTKEMLIFHKIPTFPLY